MQGDPETGDPVDQHWRLGFIAFLYIAWGQRCLSGADRGFLGRRDVSLTTYHLLGPPAVHPSVLHMNLTGKKSFKIFSTSFQLKAR
jgi:hypothetical protein